MYIYISLRKYMTLAPFSVSPLKEVMHGAMILKEGYFRVDNPPLLHFAPACCLHISSHSPRSRASLSRSKMKVIAAYLLAVLGGKTSPTAEDIKTILGAVGAEADEDRIQLLLKEVKGKDITELIASGREKLASVPSGGGGAVAVAAPAGGAGGAAPAAAEAKKEEKVEEKEESDDDMGFSLFD
ncbi:hypothetical protein ACLB2K_065813 [Fragaria x ananassa]